MQSRIVLLALLCLLVVAPAPAQILYENGPPGPDTDARTISYGLIVSDTFSLSNNSQVRGFDFWAWESPGDKVLTVDWSTTSQENGGTLYGSGTASVVVAENKQGRS